MSGNVNHFPAGLHGLVSDLEFICEVAAGPKTPLREAITKEEEKHFVIWAMPKINVLLLRMVSLFPDDYKCQGSCRKHIPSRIQTFLLKAYLCRSYCPVWHGELIFPWNWVDALAISLLEYRETVFKCRRNPKSPWTPFIWCSVFSSCFLFHLSFSFVVFECIYEVLIHGSEYRDWRRGPFSDLLLHICAQRFKVISNTT